MEEELKAVEKYLNTGGKIQSPTSLLPSKEFSDREKRALPAVMGWEVGADAAPLTLIELNWFKTADELDYLHWMEAKALKREI